MNICQQFGQDAQKLRLLKRSISLSLTVENVFSMAFDWLVVLLLANRKLVIPWWSAPLYRENSVCTRVRNYFSAHEKVTFCLFAESRYTQENRHTTSTRVCAETVRHESTYIIYLVLKTRPSDLPNYLTKDTRSKTGQIPTTMFWLFVRGNWHWTYRNVVGVLAIHMYHFAK